MSDPSGLMVRDWLGRVCANLLAQDQISVRPTEKKIGRRRRRACDIERAARAARLHRFALRDRGVRSREHRQQGGFAHVDVRTRSRCLHTGELFEPVAQPIARPGTRYIARPSPANNPEDPRGLGLEAAIASIVAHIEAQDLSDVILLGHSYGGMVITGVADRIFRTGCGA